MIEKKWFARRDLSPVGPYSEDDVRRRMLVGEISPEDLLWKDGENVWRAAIEWSEFKRLHVPAYQFVAGIQSSDEAWIVLKKTGTGFRTLGPWSQKMILQKIQEGEVSQTDHVWMKGMSGWARIASRPDFFTSSASESPSLP